MSRKQISDPWWKLLLKIKLRKTIKLFLLLIQICVFTKISIWCSKSYEFSLLSCWWHVVATNPEVSTSLHVRFSFVAVTILLIAHKIMTCLLLFPSWLSSCTRNMVLSSFFGFHIQLLRLFLLQYFFLFSPRHISSFIVCLSQRNVSISQNKYNHKYQQLTVFKSRLCSELWNNSRSLPVFVLLKWWRKIGGNCCEGKVMARIENYKVQ
jgi:hypothetical protein